MIDIELAKENFIKYTDKFDLSNEHISRKIYHTFRVMELSKNIAQSLELDEEQINLATLIRIIARYRQI